MKCVRWFVALLFLAPTLALAQQAAPSVSVQGWAGQRISVIAGEMAGLVRVEVSAQAHADSGRYSGVDLGALLQRVGAPRGDSLRGGSLASYVLVEAADGYRVVFALAELNSSFSARRILLVDRKNGAPLSPTEGPFRIVAPDELRPGRWVRQVRQIRLVRVPADTVR